MRKLDPVEILLAVFLAAVLVLAFLEWKRLGEEQRKIYPCDAGACIKIDGKEYKILPLPQEIAI